MGDDVVALGEDELVLVAERCGQGADEAEEALAAGREWQLGEKAAQGAIEQGRRWQSEE